MVMTMNNKIFYLRQDLFYCVLYAENEQDALDKLKTHRTKLLESLRLSLNIKDWTIEEFTPNLYDGILCFC